MRKNTDFDKNHTPGQLQLDQCEGRVLKGIGGIYDVLLNDGTFAKAKPRGILRRTKISPFPGDYVTLTIDTEENSFFMIDSIKERRSFIIRPTIANIDLMLITAACMTPYPDKLLIDKLIIMCIKSGIEPIICITKSDMDYALALELESEYKPSGIKIFLLGTGKQFDEKYIRLQELLNFKTVALAGQSGAGKSTLINRILKFDGMEVGKISEKISRGKHTTRHSQLFVHNSGFLADTPGFCLLDIVDMDVNGIQIEAGYPEFANEIGECKFVGCKHTGEKGCACINSKIDTNRLDRYRKLRKEADSLPSYKPGIKRNDKI